MTNAPVQAFSPRTGAPVGEPVTASTAADVEDAVAASAATFASWSATPYTERAEVLSALAASLEAHAGDLVTTADAETALGRPRLEGEVVRTGNQLRMFADLLPTGRHADVVLSPSGAGRPDLRRMLQPVGVVGVFAASNFPFAFSVLGGDTASALAAGCPVVVKAHEAHPQTSLQTLEVIRLALDEAGAPADLVTIVHGRDAGLHLVDHPHVRAVGFTGSQAGGRALFDRASSRPDPIPFYGELGSTNPVVILPHAAAERPQDVAAGYVESLTLGTGQYCTNPGLLFVPAQSRELLDAVASLLSPVAAGPMLTAGMRDAYTAAVNDRAAASDVLVLARGADPDETYSGWWVATGTHLVEAAAFADRASLHDEVFGPAGLIVTYGSDDELVAALEAVEGSLVGSVHATDDDSPLAARVIDLLRSRCGRLVFGGWPTGVAVAWAMHHGGPWPATTSARDTSVGARAIQRWLNPVCFQDVPQALLPPELQDADPWRVARDIQP
jgi:NADP-dependent aldehyde dehydrogenase